MTERENLKRVFTPGQTPEWIPYVFSAYNFIIPTDVVADRPPFGAEAGDDWFGCHWIWDGPSNGFMEDTRRPTPCTDITRWREQVVFPDLETIDWARLTAPAAAGCDPDKMTQTMLQCGLFERVHALLGFQDALVAMMTEPEAFHALMEAVTEHRVAVIRKVAEYYKPDMITNMDDYGTHKGPMMSREQFREFILPYGKRLAEAIRSHGIIYMHHSCGTFDQLLPDMVEMGVQGLTAVAPTNDVDGILAAYGDSLIYDGGMDVIGVLDRPGATEAEIRAEARRAMDKFGPTGSYTVLGYCNARAEAIVGDEVRTYGAKIYRK